MKKICLVARQNIKKPNGGGYHNDEGRYALDGIRYGAVKEIEDDVIRCLFGISFVRNLKPIIPTGG